MIRARRVVVVGGGVTGLACAHAIKTMAARERAPLAVVVLEGRARPGGNITTEHRGGFVLDGGPDSWLATKPQVEELARALSLSPEVMPTLETSRRVYIAWDGALHALPDGLMLGIPTEIAPMALTPLFSWDAKLRMALEPLVPPRRFLDDDDDESVAAFVGRRLGDEMNERLVGPLLGGIFAGDAASISVRAAFPQLVEAEAKYGSLVMAMRAAKRARMAARAEGGEGKTASVFHSLQGGLGTLIDALAQKLGGDLRLLSPVQRVARTTDDEGGRFVVELRDGELLRADDVVVAAPLRAAGRILEGVDTSIASRVAGLMGYVSSATVFFAFPRAAVEHDLDGSGFIVPRTLGRPLLAGTWVSSKWAHRAPAGHVLMRAFLGGAGREDVLALDDVRLADLALEELRRLMSIPGTPLFRRVFRFHEASPQPHVGHLGRVRRLREELATVPGLYVAASGLDGVGIPDCVKQANAIARTILERAPRGLRVTRSGRSAASRP